MCALKNVLFGCFLQCLWFPHLYSHIFGSTCLLIQLSTVLFSVFSASHISLVQNWALIWAESFNPLISDWFPWQPAHLRAFSKSHLISINWGMVERSRGPGSIPGRGTRSHQVAQWWRICLPIQEMQEKWVWSLGVGKIPWNRKCNHSSVLFWKILWTVAPGGLQSKRLQGQTRLKRLSTPGVLGLCAYGPQVVNIFHCCRWGGFLHVQNNSGNVH